MKNTMRVVFDINLNEEGHTSSMKCSKFYGHSVYKIDPLKTLGCQVIIFEELASHIGFLRSLEGTELENKFKDWVKDTKSKCGVK